MHHVQCQFGKLSAQKSYSMSFLGYVFINNKLFLNTCTLHTYVMCTRHICVRTCNIFWSKYIFRENGMLYPEFGKSPWSHCSSGCYSSSCKILKKFHEFSFCEYRCPNRYIVHLFTLNLFVHSYTRIQRNNMFIFFAFYFGL